MGKYLDYDGLGHLITKIKNEQEAGRPRIAGLVLPFAGAVAPIGYLMCDGAEYSTADYPELYAAIGRAYTASNKAETVFNVPNLIGRVPIGSGSYIDSATEQSAIHELGTTGGEAKHTLTTTEMPSHGHTTAAKTANNIASVGGYAINWANDQYESGTNKSGVRFGGTGSSETVVFNIPSLTVNNAGGGGAHNNMQPYVVTNYIISTGKIAVSESSVTDDDLQEQINAQEENISSLETRIRTQESNWDTLSQLIKTVEATVEGGTVAANEFVTVQIDLEVPEGYTPLGILDARTYANGTVIVGAYLTSSTKAAMQMRNVTSTAMAPWPWIKVLCVKQQFLK